MNYNSRNKVWTVYIIILISIIGILVTINTSRNTESTCNNIAISLPSTDLQKYRDYVKVPKNTTLKIHSFQNSHPAKKVKFLFTYQYPHKLFINYDNRYKTINLKRNRAKKLILKITNSQMSKTYYKFLVKLISKKSHSHQSVTLNSFQGLMQLKQEILQKPYLLNKLVSKYHKVIIELNDCKSHNNESLANTYKSPNLPFPKSPNSSLSSSTSQPMASSNSLTRQLVNLPTEIPSVFVLFDKSGSLNEFDRKPLKLIKSTISSILDILTNKNIKLTVGSFDDNPRWLFENIEPSNENINLIKNFINDTYADGGTNLYKILRDCSHKKTNNKVRNYLIVITDGFIYPSNFARISAKLRKKFKNTIVIGTGVEINLEFVNHLANLLKSNLYLITDENDIQELKQALMKMTGKLHSIKGQRRQDQPPLLKITNQNSDTPDSKPIIQFHNPTIISLESDSSTHFTKLYLLDKNNVYNFNVDSTSCGSFSIDGFKPFGYNEFLHNIFFKSIDYGEKLILSNTTIDSLMQNSNLKKKLIDILYNDYIEQFTKDSDSMLHKKTYHTIDAGNYLVKFAFSRFKITTPYNDTTTVNNCPNVKNKNYNSIYSLWLSLSIIILAVIKILW